MSSAGSMPADHPLRATLEFASEKAADFSAALLVFRLLSAFSVAIGADSDADAGGVDADAAAVPITAALDITLATGSIPV
jgi:hypothetical protein